MTTKNIQIINKDDISQEQTKINGNCPKFGITPRPVTVKNIPSKICFAPYTIGENIIATIKTRNNFC